MTNEKATSREHGVHVIGIGRTGGVHVEALLRTGEIEDNLVAGKTSFSALLIDIGKDDMYVPGDYARSLRTRLVQQNISTDKYHFETVSLAVPEKKEFSSKLGEARKLDGKAAGNNLMDKLPGGGQLSKVGSHTPRAIAKAIGAFGLYLDDKPIAAALDRFVDNVKKSEHDSTILIAFGLAGGTGSGMAMDLARELQKMGLGDKVKLVGVGQLSHSGDGEYHNSVAQTMAIEEIDEAVNGSAKRNPFPGGCFIISTEQSWRRLSAYTDTGQKAVRQHFKQLVTNRFVSDCFMRWVVEDGSEHLLHVLGKADGRCIMFNVAKFSHPGVQVLPGEPRSRWDSVLQQWVSFVPQYSGLVDGYSSDHIDAHIYCARNMRSDLIDNELKNILVSNFLSSGSKEYHSYSNEFFDELTAYANIILSGLKKDDLSAYRSGKARLGELKDDDLVLEKA